MTPELNRIYTGDCLAIMKEWPDKCVDLVLTDPPYGIVAASGTKGKARAHKFDYELFDDGPDYIRDVCVPAIVECIRVAKRVIVTPGSKCFTFYPQPDSFGVMYQPATNGMQKWGRADAQPIFYYGDDPRLGKTIQFCSRQVNEPPSCNLHPCSKPIDFWTWLLNRGSLEGETVLDPFLGSGTTAVAAKKGGRSFIGIEINPDYVAIAEQRLSQYQLI